MTPAETTITLVVVIGAVALAMKAFTRDERITPPSDADDVDRLLAEASGADPDAAGEVAAVDSEGWAFVPEAHGVALVPPAIPDADLPVPEGEGRSPGGHHGHGQGHTAQRMGAGDLTGARVKRGAPDLDPWRLEAVGRDGDYRAWFFETEDAARAALDLVERRVVRPPKDEDGDPRPLSPDDFDEARRLDEETERALDAPDE